jgi:hypothetical protein
MIYNIKKKEPLYKVSAHPFSGLQIYSILKKNAISLKRKSKKRVYFNILNKWQFHNFGRNVFISDSHMNYCS